jgi:hypothetical protein
MARLDALMMGCADAEKRGETQAFIDEIHQDFSEATGRWLVDIDTTSQTPNETLLEIVSCLMFFMIIEELAGG